MNRSDDEDMLDSGHIDDHHFDGPSKMDIPYLGSIEEAPSYEIDSKFILTGYRINFNTYKRVLKS